jgi:hypothetical protein
LFGNLATGHFSGKLFRNGPPPGHTGSNDTGLMTVSGPGTEPIKVQTDRQTDRQKERQTDRQKDRQTFLNIIYKIILEGSLRLLYLVINEILFHILLWGINE